MALDLHDRNQIKCLLDYNSVTSPRNAMFYVAGTDYGVPVRNLARELYNLLEDNDGIRNARAAARGDNILVPMGTITHERVITDTPILTFGQGMTTSMGAKHGLEAVPGMYDGRPDRYFDSDNDMRRTQNTGDHQFTREVSESYQSHLHISK